MVLSRLTKITGPGVATDTNWVGNNADFTGITTTATSFNIGVTTIHSTLIESHNIVSTGVITATGGSFSGNVTAVDGTFSGNVSIAGTLTYEDVTNVDSVGIVTAAAVDVDDFLDVGSNIKLGNAGVITATSFVGSGAALTGIDATAIKDSGGNVKIQAQASGAIHSGVSTFQDLDVDGHTNLDNVNIAGVTTFAGAIDLNADLDVDGHTNLDNVSIAGVTTFANNSFFNEDVFFVGASSKTITFDKSEGHIRYLDNAKAQFGTQGDLHIYHSGAASIVANHGTGDLYLQDDGNVIIGKVTNAEVGIKVIGDGAVELYHNNLKRLETSSIGVSIPQDLDVDGHTNLDNVSIAGVSTFSGILDATNTPASIRVAQDIQHKGDADTKITFPAADQISFETAGTNRLKIHTYSSNNNVEVDASAHLSLADNGSNGRFIYIGDGDASSTGYMHLQPGGGSQGFGGGIRLYSHSNSTNAGGVYIGKSHASSGAIIFGNGGMSPLNEYARITSAGQLVMGATTSKAKFEIKDNGYSSSTVLQRISGDDANPYALIIANDTCNTAAASGLQLFVSDSGEHYVRARASSTAGNNNLRLSAQNNVILYSGSSETERLRIDSSGSLLIANTTGSRTNLSNNADDIVIGNTSTSNETGISIFSTSTSGIRFNDASGTDGAIEYSHSARELRFNSAGANRLQFGINASNSPVFSLGTGHYSGDSNNHNLGDRASVKVGAYLHLESALGAGHNSRAGLGYNCYFSSAENFNCGTKSPSGGDNRPAAYGMAYGNHYFYSDASSTAHSAQASLTMTKNMEIHRQGYVLTPQTPSFYATANSGGTVSMSTPHTLTNWRLSTSGKTYDIGSNFNTSNGRFTAPVTGKYLFTGSILLAGYDQASGIHVSWRKNGTVMQYWYNTRTSDIDRSGYGGYLAQGSTTTFTLSANDYIDVHISFNGSLSLWCGDSNWGHFSGHLLG